MAIGVLPVLITCLKHLRTKLTQGVEHAVPIVFHLLQERGLGTCTTLHQSYQQVRKLLVSVLDAGQRYTVARVGRTGGTLSFSESSSILPCERTTKSRSSYHSLGCCVFMMLDRRQLATSPGRAKRAQLARQSSRAAYLIVHMPTRAVEKAVARTIRNTVIPRTAQHTSPN